jgi:hypothetical protein
MRPCASPHACMRSRSTPLAATRPRSPPPRASAHRVAPTPLRGDRELRDERVLKRRAEIRERSRVAIDANAVPRARRIARRLDAAVRKVERLVFELRHGKRNRFGSEVPCVRASDLRSPGCGRPMNFATLSKVADRVITRPIDAHDVRAAHVIDRRMTSGDHERQKSRRQRRRRSGLLKIGRVDVSSR